MKRQSELMASLKEEEMIRYQKMTPEKKLESAVRHNQFIKELFYAGLTKKGFSTVEINRLYHGERDE